MPKPLQTSCLQRHLPQISSTGADVTVQLVSFISVFKRRAVMSRGRPFQSAALLRKEDAARIFCRNIWEQLGRNGIYGEICWLGEQDMVHNEALALFLQVQPSLGCAEEGFTAALPYQPDIKSFARASRCPVIEIVQPFFVSTSATPSVTSSHVDIPAAIRSCPPAISTSGLGSSTSDMMLNQFCFIVQMALVLWCSLVQHNSDCLCEMTG
ncbi:uncharacterized protein LOC144113445 isoform X2 [Amblyomma americanum]